MDELVKLLREVLVSDGGGTPEAQLFLTVAKLSVPGLLTIAAALVSRGALRAASLSAFTAVGIVSGLVAHHYLAKPSGELGRVGQSGKTPAFDLHRDHSLTTRHLMMQSRIESVSDCERACIVESNCNAFVFDLGAKTCALHKDSAKPTVFRGSIVGIRLK